MAENTSSQGLSAGQNFPTGTAVPSPAFLRLQKQLRRENTSPQPTENRRENQESEVAAIIEREAGCSLATNSNLAGCLPSIVKARHGVCVTSAGWIVHWSSLDSDTVWDHMCADLDLDNYVMLYTSKILAKKRLADTIKREILNEIINDLGKTHYHTNSAEQELMIIDVNRNMDLMLAFRNKATAQTITSEHYTTLQTEMLGEVIIPNGPLIPHGMINYRRYLVRANVTPGIPQARIAEKLGRRYKLCEVIANNVEIDGKAAQIQKGSLECYIEFNNQDEALNMAKEIEVDGALVKLWHKGYYECDTCKLKGHTAEYHEMAMKAMERNKKRREKRNKRCRNN